MKSITIALPDYLLVRFNPKPEDIRSFLKDILDFYEEDIKDKQPIELYTEKTTKVTLRVEERTAYLIRKYAGELNISILMFTACLANMYHK